MKLFLGFIIGMFSLSLLADDVERLKEGNQRFIQKDYELKELVSAQHPFCAILACADSRVAPELIFDQHLGDLFVVRIAGNVATKGVKESLDFASNVLKVSTVLVMGHQNCGAVDAVWTHEGELELGTLASIIKPAVKDASTLKQAIITNVQNQVATLKQLPILQNRMQLGTLEIVGAYYDFETGLVEFFHA